MPLTVDVKVLIEWLGPKGAKAALQASNLSLRQLIELTKQKKLPMSPKPTRDELANELVFSNAKVIEKSADQLMSMTRDEVLKYLKRTRPSRSEILALLATQGVDVKSEASKNLMKFAAQELSDLGMYQRVSRGSRGNKKAD
jgi:hypothetical protein